MHRTPLLDLLKKHRPFDEEERRMLHETISFVSGHEDCFERSQLSGHVTASAWIVDSAVNKVLLMHHKKLGKWFQPGGHCDGDGDTWAVARKEAEEETGVELTRNGAVGIFDIDIHLIPGHKGIPAHFHYDVRYLFEVGSGQEIKQNIESNAVAWIPLDQVSHYNSSESIMRMVRKVQITGTAPGRV